MVSSDKRLLRVLLNKKMPNKIFTKGENLWAQKSNVASGISNIPDQCCSRISWWLLLTIFRSIEKPDSFWNTLLSWLRFGAKVKSLAEIDSRPLSELSIDKSFTKKSQNWRLYNRIQIWLRTIRRSRLLIIRTIVIEMVDYCQLSPLTWSTIVKGPGPNTRGRPFFTGIVNFVIALAQY